MPTWLPQAPAVASPIGRSFKPVERASVPASQPVTTPRLTVHVTAQTCVMLLLAA
ncbi:hypothetical protein SAMN05216199_2285 [Pedococcus cremeus]|uniref:Uncharacterized protein n=1 Tax=Pedococcus cremeus TaxID=587636 RepID=A0A1H9V411_9MICO|nr:hypothetical protein SAMN05216199_2285 [Pedococcus cremeus]